MRQRSANRCQACGSWSWPPSRLTAAHWNGPVDGYFLHGTFWFGSGRNSVRMRHLAARPAVSATHLPGQELSVTVHGRAELFDLLDPARGELRRAMLDYYLPTQGPDFETWLRKEDPIGARIVPEKIIALSFPT